MNSIGVTTIRGYNAGMHAPEPYRIDEDGIVWCNRGCLLVIDKWPICGETVRRMVECSNALAGIPANDLPRVRKLWDDHKLTAMGHGKPSEILDMMTREQVE